MKNPTVDIIVPVWNNPFETRGALAAILEHSPNTRLIVVSNGSSRKTELMLEEFSERLGENALFLLSDKNLGTVAAINRGLSRSDSDYAMVLNPSTIVTAGWLESLLLAAENQKVGIVTPVFYGCGAPRILNPVKGCSTMETCSISFSALLLNGTMRMLIGGFDENLDAGEWTLFDYLRRAENAGYKTVVTSKCHIYCQNDSTVKYGSPQRRGEQKEASKQICNERWGIREEYYIYPGKHEKAEGIEPLIELALQKARIGNKVTFLLHWKQYLECTKRGWQGLHTALILKKLPLFRGEQQAEKIAAESPKL